MAEWLRSGLQRRLHRFDSGWRLFLTAPRGAILVKSMPRDRVDIVRGYLGAWTGEPIEPSVEEVDSDVEIDWSESHAPYAGVYSGHGGWRRLFGEMSDSFQGLAVEAHEYIAVGPYVAVPNTVRLQGRAGIEVQATSTVVFTFRDDKIAAVRVYQSDADARAAIGAG